VPLRHADIDGLSEPRRGIDVEFSVSVDDDVSAIVVLLISRFMAA
jgi:hypothetical protein